ncbi:hypothetical protein LEP1GSC127_4728 [Leptospira kirschneri str. 200801925]|uniref:Uncharacterized protein n=1 Tax=Leptospira kirschneri str. 200802841 TaxID=1193047 RepID=A0A828XZG8_9LEPT|nr:hypothetical protein LEP1GSC044_3815 [Leptospira kirschneri serovar Grippotyphosa str. RM52]EKO50026.1 hypothetical protein LEP1GSC131_1809 [Leptospira kirschneri str. 200802841]EKP03733.1 hypothetical protein LEP1GSC018_0870 [Leptospira kirschneri str. 2008720114]EMK02734.1 hypothetical protein LEP1GSC176_1096 [Leptospira kirschneri str. MMD1493]EMK12614.1 hypothetical protein LEP1GSC042_0601 [Leptospira kirschneri serovar Bim str. PUO 1247]EMN04660.1 hypothetical protein LEP1GSC046_1611 [
MDKNFYIFAKSISYFVTIFIKTYSKTGTSSYRLIFLIKYNSVSGHSVNLNRKIQKLC